MGSSTWPPDEANEANASAAFDSEFDFSTLDTSTEALPPGSSTLASFEDQVLHHQVRVAALGESHSIPKLGRFRVDRILGRGGMSIVYAAHDRQLNRPVAIKMLRRGLVLSKGEGDTVLREARALARLTHSRVVHVHEIGHLGHHLYIVLEYVEGMTLRQWLAGPDMPTTRELVSVLLDAARGLAAAHDCGLVHLDFKPDNVLVDSQARAKVADFGLVEMVLGGAQNPAVQPETTPAVDTPADDKLPGPAMVPGTPRYMSPEQARGLGCDTRSDQYSYCLTVCECFALRRGRDFEGRHALDGRYDAGDLARLVADVPSRLRSVVRRGLSEHPGRRAPSMEALCRALQAELEGTARKRSFTWAVGTVIVGCIVAFTKPWHTPWRDACENAADDFAELELGERMTTVADTLRRASNDYTQQVAQLASNELTAAVDAWHRQHDQICRAAGSGRLFELASDQPRARLQCLELVGTALDAVVDTLTAAASSGKTDFIVEGMHRVHAGLRECELNPDQLGGFDSDGERETASLVRDLVRGRTAGWMGDWHTAQLHLAAAEQGLSGEAGFSATQSEAARLSAWFTLQSGKVDEAEAILTRALTIAQRSNSPKARLRCLIDFIHLETQHRADYRRARAHALLAQTLSSHPAIDAANRARLGLTLAELASARAQFSEALAHIEAALESIDVDELPWERARALWLRGEVQANLRRYDAAGHDYNEAAGILAEHFGDRHPDQIRLLYRRAKLEHYAANYPGARERFGQALALADRVLPRDHEITAETLSAAAGIEFHLGARKVASEMAERALAMAQRLESPSLNVLAVTMNRAASIRKRNGQRDSAIALFDDLQALLDRRLEGPHRLRTFPLLNSSSFLREDGQFDEARRRLEAAIANEEAIYGEGHTSIFPMLKELEELERAIGNRSGELAVQRRVEAIFRQRLERLYNSPRATSREAEQATIELGFYYNKIKQFAKAVEVFAVWIDRIDQPDIDPSRVAAAELFRLAAQARVMPPHHVLEELERRWLTLTHRLTHLDMRWQPNVLRIELELISGRQQLALLHLRELIASVRAYPTPGVRKRWYTALYTDLAPELEGLLHASEVSELGRQPDYVVQLDPSYDRMCSYAKCTHEW